MNNEYWQLQHAIENSLNIFRTFWTHHALLLPNIYINNVIHVGMRSMYIRKFQGNSLIVYIICTLCTLGNKQISK